MSESKIKQDPKNARLHSEVNKEQINKSLKDLGAGRSVVIDNEDYLIAGNGVYEQAEKLGLKTKVIESDGTELVVIKRTDLNYEDEKRRKLAIADNATSESSDWNFEELTDDEIEEWGIEEHQEEEIQLEAKEDDFVEEVPEIPISVLGDLYEIGEHRLLCGDSTNSDEVAKLMDGKKAELAHNDPPYGMKKENEGVLNDNLNYSDLLNFNKEWISLQFSHLKDNGSWYCWGIDEPLMDIYSEILKPFIEDQKATFRNLITWNKGNGQGQLAEDFRSYPNADEKCLFVMCGVQGFNNNADNYFEGWESIRDYLLAERQKAGWDVPKMKRVAGHSDLSRDHWTCKSQWNMPTEKVYKTFQSWCLENNVEAFKKEYNEIKKEYNEIKKEYNEIKKEYYSTRAYFNNTHDNMNNVWHFKRTSSEERKDVGKHATPKPIELCERVIKSSCPENGLVLDMFLGSGSTMVATHQLKRKCYGMELDPKYCDVIVKRMLNLDSKLTIKRNGIDCTEDFKTA